MAVKVNQTKVDELAEKAYVEKIESLCAEISAERIKRLSAGFEYNGTMYPMDTEAQGVYSALANAITAGIAHANVIRTMDNRTINVTDDELIGIGTACLISAGAVNIAAWTAKDQIRESVDFDTAQTIFKEYMNDIA